MQLSMHKPWEDWLGAAFGVLILISPAIARTDITGPVMFSTLAVGIIVLGLALFEIMMTGRWEEILSFLAGAWLAVSGFVLDYGAAMQLRPWHFVLGLLVAILAAFEFWQDTARQQA
jgi:hypothetical protein